MDGLVYRCYEERDCPGLVRYFGGLGQLTRQRFGPHQFDEQSVRDLYRNTPGITGYLALTPKTGEVVAYAIIRQGILEHDRERLNGYGLTLSDTTDCTYAPSVADAWQGRGIGNEILSFILKDLQMKGIKRMILWGGVQAGNLHAVKYYLKNGFSILGEFQHMGSNYDMIKAYL